MIGMMEDRGRRMKAEGKQREEPWEMKRSNHSYRSPLPYH